MKGKGLRVDLAQTPTTVERNAELSLIISFLPKQFHLQKIMVHPFAHVTFVTIHEFPPI